MTSLSIEIPNDLHVFIAELIASGQVAGPSELVVLALFAFRDQVELDQITHAELQREIAVGLKEIKRCRFADYDQGEFLAEANARAAAKAA